MEHKEQLGRIEDFSNIYQEMDLEDQEKITLTANKLLIAQKVIKDEKNLNKEGEDKNG